MSDIDYTARDKQWARRIREGDGTAFEKLFRAYAAPLCTFVHQYTNAPEIAEELVQDLFLKLWKGRAQWAPTVSVKSYLYVGARNLALNYLEHERVVEAWKHHMLCDGRPPQPTPDERLDQKQLRLVIQRAIDKLPERRKLVFTLSRKHGLTYREIATVMDISIKTVETHMHRAFRSLRAQLASYRPATPTSRSGT